jgi:hypothetical protein
MVRHLRVVRRGVNCIEDCPHEEAPRLWSAAQSIFGTRANDLAFLRSHGQGAVRVPARVKAA